MRISVLLLALASLPALAFDGMVPAQTVPFAFSKKVTSLRDARYAHVVEQKTDYSCGAAALATLLTHAYSRPVDEQAIILGMFETGDRALIAQQGFSMLDMKRYLEAQGLRAGGFVVDMEKLRTLKVPAIVLLNDGGYKHFVVLRRFSDSGALVADPALGNRTIPAQDFLRQWNKVLLVAAGPGYRLDNPLMKPGSLVAARFDRLRAPLQSELLEFGFKHSDFF